MRPVALAFVVITVLDQQGFINNSTRGLLVPICCYIVMAVSSEPDGGHPG